MQTELLGKKDIFLPNESIYIQKSSRLPQYVETLHTHDFIELTCVIQGMCYHTEYDINGNVTTYQAKKGDVFIIKNGTPHANFISTENTAPFIAYDCAFTPDFATTLLTNYSFIQNKAFLWFRPFLSVEDCEKPNMTVSGNGLPEIEKIFEKMFREYNEKASGYQELLNTYLIELFVKIFRQLETAKDGDVLNKQKAYIFSAVQYLKENYGRKISLHEIASNSFLSPSYFSALFKEMTGSSFSKYLQKIRIEKACELLKNSDEKIGTIADKVGFYDIKPFYNAFKKLVGVTPNEFRRKGDEQSETDL